MKLLKRLAVTTLMFKADKLKELIRTLYLVSFVCSNGIASFHQTVYYPFASPLPLSIRLFWSVMSVIPSLDVLTGIFATIIVYRRLGFTDSTNMSLTALAVSDLVVAVTTFNCVLAAVLPTIPNASFDSTMFMSTSSTVHVIFTRVSALITTYLSLERYLCVLLPLKVKNLVTPRMTFLAMLILFVSHHGPLLVNFFQYPIGWKTFPSLNRTFLVALPPRDEITMAFHDANEMYLSLLLPVLTFFTF
ncbi:hypothetical protein RRG08_048626 [Elysia crispata]|uniref:G-protein coupled receptors family 1 profile domain-containing protein n=1 Tax=Elysia crispata TaxID=231223 RepID=A0AAE1DWP3_9GAST|nr:hypothetical protein RRG08_048626 [Elysia crispata]